MKRAVTLVLIILGLIFTPFVSASSTVNKIKISTPTPTPTPEPLFLKSVSPSSGDFFDDLTIRGTGFGSSSGFLWFYNSQGQNVGGAGILSWEDNKIKATVPAIQANAEYLIEVQKADGSKSNKVSFKMKRGQPIFDDLTPSTRTSNGTYIIDKDNQLTITGTQFGKFRGKVNFYWENSPLFAEKAKIISWSETQIVFTIPKVTANNEYGLQIETSDDRVTSMKYVQVTP